MNLQDLSSTFEVRLLAPPDIPKLLELCKGNPFYYQHCPPPVSAETLLNDMQTLPPGVSMQDKYYVGFFDGETLLAVMDLISAFPERHTAFIGFFMTEKARQGKGLGTLIVTECLQALKALGFAKVRLGVGKGNHQAERFWRKNKFSPTGDEKEATDFEVMVMERVL